MASIPSTLMSSGSNKKEPRYVYLSEARASHSHKLWTEFSSSEPCLLQVGLLHSPITCKCLLKVSCPVSRPITTLVCVLLKDNIRAPVARSGPEINSQACLCVLQGPRTTHLELNDKIELSLHSVQHNNIFITQSDQKVSPHLMMSCNRQVHRDFLITLY